MSSPSVKTNPTLERFRVERKVPNIESFPCGRCNHEIKRENIGWYAWTTGVFLRYFCPNCGSVLAPKNTKITEVLSK